MEAEIPVIIQNKEAIREEIATKKRHLLDKEKSAIIFTLVYQGKEYAVHTYRNEHYSLMTLISHYIGLHDFGLCCGMGSCGTCIVDIYSKGSINKRNTLSCDIQVNEELSNTIVVIPG